MGRVDSVGIALQPAAEQKTAASGPVVFPPLTSESIEPNVTTLEHIATIGSRAPERSKRGGRSFAGNLEGGIRPLSFGTLLSMAWGSPTTTQPNAAQAPTVYRHTWNPVAAGKNPLPATVWTVNADDPDEIVVDEYIGAMINELAWNLEGNDYLLFTAGIQAIRNIEAGVAPVATRDSSELWSSEEIKAEISVPSISAGAYAEIALYAWNFAYTNNLTGGDRYRIGSSEIVRLRPGNIGVTVGFTAAEELESHYRRAIARQPELVKMRLTANGRLLYDDANPLNDLYEAIQIEVKAIEYTSGNIAISADTPLEDLPVEGNGVLDSGGALLSVILTNTHDGTNYQLPA